MGRKPTFVMEPIKLTSSPQEKLQTEKEILHEYFAVIPGDTGEQEISDLACLMRIGHDKEAGEHDLENHGFNLSDAKAGLSFDAIKTTVSSKIMMATMR